MKENESIESIVAEMRRREKSHYYPKVARNIMHQYAGRIEAARTAEKSSAVGNAAAMREALVAVKKSIDGMGISSLDCDPTILMAALTQVCASLSARIERALAAPPRNCDLYSDAREAFKAHEEAFNESNFHHGECKLGCPDCDDYAIRCEIKWLFAPAERKGEDR